MEASSFEAIFPGSMPSITRQVLSLAPTARTQISPEPWRKSDSCSATILPRRSRSTPVEQQMPLGSLDGHSFGFTLPRGIETRFLAPVDEQKRVPSGFQLPALYRARGQNLGSLLQESRKNGMLAHTPEPV